MYCIFLYTATLFIVSVRFQVDEVRVSDSDNSRHWCGISMIPTTPTDASGDADSEAGATVKSLIKSFDTVGQSEHRAPQHALTHTHGESQRSNVTKENSCEDLQISVISLQQSHVQLCGAVWSGLTSGGMEGFSVFVRII